MAWKRFKGNKCEICGWTEVLNCHHIIPRSDVFEYDIYNCPQELKGQLKIGDFSC